ncbi:MAG: hypothetical protein WCZ66_08140 [Sphingomonadaceae bacterium]
MKPLRIITLVVGLLLGGGEIARWWGDARFVPLAFDELFVSAALLLAAARPRATIFAAGWGMFCGLAVTLLVPTVDHVVHGPPKDGAIFYTVILSAGLVLGLWAVWRAIGLDRGRSRGR